MDHTDVGLRAVVRALVDVVTPAVDAENALAREQLRLSIDYIEFVSQRLEYLQEREVFDLRNHLAMAREVGEIAGDLEGRAEGRRLGEAIAKGDAALSAGTPPMRTLKAATAGLAAAVADMVRIAPTLAPSVSTAIEKAVIRFSKERIAFERSWYRPLGFDPDSEGVPSVRAMIDSQRAG